MRLCHELYISTKDTNISLHKRHCVDTVVSPHETYTCIYMCKRYVCTRYARVCVFICVMSCVFICVMSCTYLQNRPIRENTAGTSKATHRRFARKATTKKARQPLSPVATVAQRLVASLQMAWSLLQKSPSKIGLLFLRKRATLCPCRQGNDKEDPYILPCVLHLFCAPGDPLMYRNSLTHPYV